MGGRALAAFGAAALQVFLLFVIGTACAVDARAETPPADLASPSPSETDQEPPSPAAAPADEISASPASASPGEDEPAAIPAAAPASEAGRAPADTTDTAALAPGDAQPPAAGTAAPAPNTGEQQPADAASPGDNTVPTVAEEAPADPVVATIRLTLQDPALRKGVAADDLAALEAFYGERTGPPLWITGMGFSARAQTLIAEIQKAGNWGLAPEAFDLPPSSDLPATIEAQATDEIKLAIAVLKYARFARGGRMSPARISNLFDQKPDLPDPKAVLTEITAAASPGAYLTSLHPKQEQFEILRRALIKAVASSKARGRKPGSDATIQRLIVNMERWRWMPADLGSYYVWNNIPAFTARVIKNGKSIYVEKVIVGQLKYATPIFSAQMRSIVFNPEWAVPETIKLEDLQPRLRQSGPGGGPDVSILRENKLSVSYQGRPVDPETIDWGRANILQYTFIQPPGPDNVLGTLKFNFPNRHAIYMHDTVQPELFKETVRTLSHGCIRVHQPDRLATLLLAEDKGWSEQQVTNRLAKGNSAVSLSRPVPVHLTYFTAAADGAGTLQTYDDVYGIDKKMASVLFGKAESLSAVDDEAPVKPKKRNAWNQAPGGFANAISGLFGN
jgi:L,D-transpeptidase YcbB